jgi:ribonuclease P protein component
MVIPKRHARRAVTRNAIRRLVRAVVRELASRLPPGAWLVRLRTGFGEPRGPAMTALLKRTARAELNRLFTPVLLEPVGQAVK